MNKKKIGIVGWVMGNGFGITLAYANFINQFGEPIILHPNSAVRDDLDLLIIPGGPDVDVTRYGQIPGLYTGKPCQIREYFDKVVLSEYIRKEVPMFCICRGMQSIAIHFGAQLHQDIVQEHNDSDKRWELVHNVKFTKDIKFGKFEVKKDQLIGVNSIHHQAVDYDSLKNTPFEVIATHEDRNNVEIIQHKSIPIIGVQHHPEETFDKFSMNAVQYLLNYYDEIDGEDVDFEENDDILWEDLELPTMKEEVNG